MKTLNEDNEYIKEGFDSELYIIKLHNAEIGEYLVEIDGEEEIIEEESLIYSLKDSFCTVTYNEDDEDLVESLKYTTVKYISVETYADGSNEHDIYEHNIIFQDGKANMDKGGKFIKSYKRLASAIKFAESLGGYEVKVN